MYQVEAWSALTTALGRGPSRGWRSVSRNVLALGVTSLLTDVSSEMTATVLPVYLVLHLGLTPLSFGVIDGLYNGATAILRLLGGVVADRIGRYKEVAGSGYALSAICKIGLLGAGGSWTMIAAVVALDRAAKGLRTAPRDALISLSSQPANLATSFGVHRALDSAGAMLGPVVALAVLTVYPTGFDVIFVTSFSVAVAGVGVLFLYVENSRITAEQPSTSRILTRAVRTIIRDKRLLALSASAVMLSVVTISDGFLYLALQRSVGFRAGLLPLLYVGTATSYLALAVPAGRIADRWGRRRTFMSGYAVLALAYLTVMADGIGNVVMCVLCVGGYYALTEGVLMALASRLLPPEALGTGLALLTTLTSVGRFASSLAFGAVWTAYGLRQSVVVFLLALMIVAGIAMFVLHWSDTKDAR